MIKTALITCATNGIGFELAKIHAEKGDNLALVARNKGKLDELNNELEEKHKVKVYAIGKDLSGQLTPRSLAVKISRNMQAKKYE